MSDKNRQMARRLAEAVAQRGGRVYYVGGQVRDRLMGRESKDVDVEVHGILPDALEEILHSLGGCTQMGKSFGIYGLRHYDLDIAMPRTEQANGRGHRDFTVFTDPFLGTEKAAKRRDFTVNAMMEDVLTGEIVDPFGGKADLQRGILRHVNDESFAEDPLRVLRGAQFAARFGFTVEESTLDLCRRMDLSALAAERVFGETEKALLKAPRPSVYFQLLRQMEQESLWFFELSSLCDFSLLDRAAALRRQAKEPLPFLFCALCLPLDDFGSSPRLPKTRSFLGRLTKESRLHQYVMNTLELFPSLGALSREKPSAEQWNLLFDRALCPEDLLLLHEAATAVVDPVAREALSAYFSLMTEPSVMGADLLSLGLAPGKDFGEALAYAHRLHLAGVPKEEALPLTVRFLKKRRE